MMLVLNSAAVIADIVTDIIIRHKEEEAGIDDPVHILSINYPSNTLSPIYSQHNSAKIRRN